MLALRLAVCLFSVRAGPDRLETYSVSELSFFQAQPAPLIIFPRASARSHLSESVGAPGSWNFWRSRTCGLRGANSKRFFFLSEFRNFLTSVLSGRKPSD